MRLVIIGCGGFIGSHLLDRLLDGDRDVRIEGWDPHTAKIHRHLGDPRLRLHQEYTDAPGAMDRIREVVRGADIVMSLAAICNPSEYNTRPLRVLRANLFEVYPLIDLCAELNKWLIHFSTSEVYGRTISSYLPEELRSDPAYYELSETTSPLIMGPIENQRWTYACAKQLIERLIYAHHRESGLPFTIIRPLNFFGPRMDYLPGRDGEGVPRVLACFLTALLDGEPMKVVDGGHARRTIVSIHDAIDAIELMLDKPAVARNRIFNIGNRANEVTMRELAERMRAAYSRVTGDPRHLDHPIRDVSALEFYGEGYEDCDRRMPDLTAARSLGWEPRTPLDDILLETVAFYHALYATPAQAVEASPR